MTQPADYPMFAVVCALGIIAFLSCLQSYLVGVQTDMARKRAEMAHLRLDRMQKGLKVGNRETVSVPYHEGWVPKGEWTDDFKKTQVLNTHEYEYFRTSRWKKLWRWLLNT